MIPKDLKSLQPTMISLLETTQTLINDTTSQLMITLQMMHLEDWTQRILAE